MKVDISAAAPVARRAVVLSCLLALIGAVGASAMSSAVPLVQVTPNELRLREPLATLAADGHRAAFAFCNQLVGVWRAGSTGVTRLGPVAQWSCPPPRGAERIHSIAFAGDRVAWASEAGGNVVTNLLFLVVLAAPHTLTIAAETDYCCRGLDPDPERMGDVYGDGSFIAFSSRVKCGDLGATTCAGPARTLVSQTAWRLRRPPYQSNCVNKPGPCQQLETSSAALRPLSVDSGRVVLLKPGGTLEVMGANGAPVRTFANSAVTGAELMGGRLLMLVPGHIREYKIQTGTLVRTRPLPNVTSAGVCGMPPCPSVALRLVDAKRGLVAYIQSGKLHLLRLRDGRNRIVHRATDARFGDNGLFYAFSGAAPWVSRIRFVPWRALPLQP
jgi:hypothetical protein